MKLDPDCRGDGAQWSSLNLSALLEVEVRHEFERCYGEVWYHWTILFSGGSGSGVSFFLILRNVCQNSLLFDDAKVKEEITRFLRELETNSYNMGIEMLEHRLQVFGQKRRLCRKIVWMFHISEIILFILLIHQTPSRFTLLDWGTIFFQRLEYRRTDERIRNESFMSQILPEKISIIRYRDEKIFLTDQIDRKNFNQFITFLIYHTKVSKYSVLSHEELN